MTNEMDVGQISQPDTGTNSASTNVQPQYQQPQQQVDDRRFTQGDLDRVAKKRAQEAYERGLREASSTPAQGSHVDQPRSGTTNHFGGMPQQSLEDIERMIDEKATTKLKELRQQEQADYHAAQNNAYNTQIAEKFIGKVVSGKDIYPDFEQKVAELNLQSIAPIIPHLVELDNMEHVLYDIANNPSKAANLLVLAERAPHLAKAEAERLSQALSQIKNASTQKQSNPPLQSLKPSYEGTDSGSMTINDLRRQSWLKG
jgi:hypothetical protein